jgi:Predicted glycosyltransferases
MLSIIIPSYDRDEELIYTLDSIKSNNMQLFDFEIIVVDYGKHLKTEMIVKKKCDGKNTFFYKYIEAENLNIAKMRNFGASVAKGEKILFLDSGMILDDNFFKQYDNRKKTYKINDVLLCNVFAFGEELDEKNKIGKELLNIINKKDWEKIYSQNKWRDYRSSCFILNSDNSIAMKSPWTMAWSTAIIYSKKFFWKIGGFDEKFEKWGGEDTELGYRAFKNDANFYFERELKVVHLPHERTIGFNRNKEIESIRNRRYIHKKHDVLETEAYIFFNGAYMENILSLLEKISFIPYNPQYKSADLQVLQNKKKKSVGIGFDSLEDAKILNCTTYLVVNNKVYDIFNKSLKEKKISRTMCLRTNYKNKEFEYAVVANSYQYLPKEFYEIFEQEVQRIANKVIYLYTKEHIPIIYSNNIKEIKKIMEEDL